MKMFSQAILVLMVTTPLITLSQGIPLCSNPDPEPGMTSNVWDFSSPPDTTRWKSEDLEEITGQPEIQWVSTYDNATGVMKLGFTKTQQGVKLTLQKSDWFSSSSGKWYRLRTRLKSDSNTQNSAYAMSYLYNGAPPGPTDFNGSGINSILSKWVTLETYQESVGGDTSMYVQFVIRNFQTFPFSLYIDRIEIEEVSPPPMVDYPYEGARFEVLQPPDTYWQYETPVGAAVQADYKVTNNSLNVSFSGFTSQGLKMTMGMKPGVVYTFQRPPNELTGQRATFTFKGTMKNSYIFVSSYGTDKPERASGYDNEQGVAARLNRFSDGDVYTLRMIYRAQQKYSYGQVIVKNNAPGNIILSNLYPIIEK